MKLSNKFFDIVVNEGCLPFLVPKPELYMDLTSEKLKLITSCLQLAHEYLYE